jgi:hypothetical protein
VTLSDMKPLSKVHWPYGLNAQHLAAPTDDVRQVLRVCGGVGLQLHLLTDAQLAQAVGLARELSLPACVHWSPWQERRVKTGTPAELIADVALFERQIAKVAATGIEVRAVFFDDERTSLAPDSMLHWRGCLYRIAKSAYPSASVEWYDYGGIRPANNDSGWGQTSHLLGVPTDAWAVSLYRPGELEIQRGAYRRTCAAAPAEMPVTPWISLGAGYRLATETYQTWLMHWPYESSYDALLGREINGIDWYSARPERFAPWKRARHVVLYPPPLDPRVPAWLDHFEAYAVGAQR